MGQSWGNLPTDESGVSIRMSFGFVCGFFQAGSVFDHMCCPAGRNPLLRVEPSNRNGSSKACNPHTTPQLFSSLVFRFLCRFLYIYILFLVLCVLPCLSFFRSLVWGLSSCFLLRVEAAPSPPSRRSLPHFTGFWPSRPITGEFPFG